MSWIRNMKISLKLGLGFALGLVLSAILGGVAVQQMVGLNTTTKDIVTNSFGPVLQFCEFRFAVRQLRIDEFRAIVANSPLDISNAQSDVSKDLFKCQDDLNKYQATIRDPQDKQNFSVLLNDWAQYQQLDTQLQPLVSSNNDKGSQSLMENDMSTCFKSILADDITIVKYDQKHIDTTVANANTGFVNGRNVIIGLLLLIFAIGGVAATLITRYIVGMLNPISDRFTTLNGECITSLNNALGALENGDLTATLNDAPSLLVISSDDEFGK